jgi:hypothetical protein
MRDLMVALVILVIGHLNPIRIEMRGLAGE